MEDQQNPTTPPPAAPPAPADPVATPAPESEPAEAPAPAEEPAVPAEPAPATPAADAAPVAAAAAAPAAAAGAAEPATATGGVTVNQETCVGCGRCTEVCPEVFCLASEGDAAGKSEVCGTVNAENLDKVKQASDECPVGAIAVQE